jgi:hypothetical protein
VIATAEARAQARLCARASALDSHVSAVAPHSHGRSALNQHNTGESNVPYHRFHLLSAGSRIHPLRDVHRHGNACRGNRSMKTIFLICVLVVVLAEWVRNEAKAERTYRIPSDDGVIVEVTTSGKLSNTDRTYWQEST